MRIRILIADDHAVVRAGVRALVGAEPDMEVVGEVADGTAVVQETQRFRPNVVLLDITMPGLAGPAATRDILERLPDTKVIVLTMHDDVGYLRQFFEAGAMGYVLKSAADTELLFAIRAVSDGNQFVDPSLAGRALVDLLGATPPPEGEDEPALSDREMEVLVYVARGYTNREAAQELHLSPKTVQTYRMRVMDKLQLRTRAELVQYALRRGLLEDS